MLSNISHSWSDFDNLIHSYLSNSSINTILEIGGGHNPYFTEEVIKKYNLEYHIIDIDDSIHKKEHYNLTIHNLEKSPLPETYDLIFSHMVLEHLKDPLSFHQNILEMTHEQTFVCHFFATKYGLPSLANLLLPSSISDFIIYKIQKRNPSTEGKYPAYYKKCIGPTQTMKSWYTELGYQVIIYNGYLGHGYLGRFKWLSFFEQLWKKFLLKLNSPYLCSNAMVVMKRDF